MLELAALSASATLGGEIFRFMPATEVAEAGLIHAWSCAGGTLIRHDGTGEQLVLEGIWCIEEFDGNVLVRSPGGLSEVEWLSEKLTKALLQDERPGYPEPQLIVLDIASGKRTWQETVHDQECRSRVIKLVGGLQTPELITTVYISEIPRSGACVRWGLQRAITYVLGAAHDGRWLTHHVPRIVKVLEDHLGFENATINPSPRSVLWRQRQEGGTVDAEALKLCDPEWSCGTSVLFGVLCWACSQTRLAVEVGVEPDVRAASLIDAIVAKFVTGGGLTRS